MTDLIDDRSFRYLAAWSLVFISVVFLFGSIGRWLSNQMRQPGLNFGNRLLGAGFGVARGVVIAAILLLMLKGLLPESERHFGLTMQNWSKHRGRCGVAGRQLR